MGSHGTDLTFSELDRSVETTNSDALHRPDPPGKKGWFFAAGVGSEQGWVWSTRGFFNVLVLGFLLGGLLMLFAGYPILTYYRKEQRQNSAKGSFKYVLSPIFCL